MTTLAMALHIAGGAIGLTSGFVAAFSRKGGLLHRRAGAVFIVSMLVMALFAVYLAVAIPDQRVNVFIATLAAYLVVSGWMSVHHPKGAAGAAGKLTLLVSLILFSPFAILTLQLATGMPPLFRSAVPFEGPVLVALYALTGILALATIGDARVVIAGGISGAPRILRHLWRMCLGLALATGSAFTNGIARLLPGPYHVPLYFHLPKLLPFGLLVFWFVRVRFTRWHRESLAGRPAADAGFPLDGLPGRMSVRSVLRGHAMISGTLMKTATKRIGLLGFEGANAQDLVGPAEVFSTASALHVPAGRASPAYEVLLLSLGPRGFRSESGIALMAHACCDDAPPLDTLVVAGGPGLRVPAVTAAAARWIRSREAGTRRLASVCTGAFGLAATGLLDGRRVTTHWRWAKELARRHPAIQVDARSLYLRDGRFYTGGGITAGIDLALALVEEDLGPAIALATARELLVYLKRPGDQEQYSEPLRNQEHAPDRLADLLAWIDGHPAANLDSSALAQRARISVRQLSRCFRDPLGCTPAEYVGRSRLAMACRLLVDERRAMGSIAHLSGYASANGFRRAFERHYGLSPAQYRERFARSPAHLPGAMRTARASSRQENRG